jgi:hypothetical protein
MEPSTPAVGRPEDSWTAHEWELARKLIAYIRAWQRLREEAMQGSLPDEWRALDNLSFR